ncbi:hypothetical protein [Methylobacterium adhaesivum]|uniref:Uncharacterized protein n=1 Tax=Methylobacterium adhaesivum TaxID=333297 RepID=A0ABT8BLQ7_9HYPH|nr:hypothetical protein [Methylobacterium adhaesivum]MDN3592133.1 hypothetical protein [Methylobacterium adhaesivum]
MKPIALALAASLIALPACAEGTLGGTIQSFTNSFNAGAAKERLGFKLKKPSCESSIKTSCKFVDGEDLGILASMDGGEIGFLVLLFDLASKRADKIDAIIKTVVKSYSNDLSDDESRSLSNKIAKQAMLNDKSTIQFGGIKVDASIVAGSKLMVGFTRP